MCLDGRTVAITDNSLTIFPSDWKTIGSQTLPHTAISADRATGVRFALGFALE
jgi:hypothetical protein